jgi:hypothetical protein
MERNRHRGGVAVALVAAAALSVAAVAGAGVRDDGRPVPTAVLKPVNGSGVYGSASFGPYQGGTLTALVVHGRVLFRGIDDVAFEDVADGEHVVVIVSRGRVVAYGIVPRE